MSSLAGLSHPSLEGSKGDAIILRTASGIVRHSSRLTFAVSAIVLAALSGVSPSAAADLICSTPTTISTPTTYDNVTVQSGCTLTVDTVLTVNVNMTVQSGGVVTHTLRQVNGLVLNVGGTLDVQSGGLIDTNGKGLRGAGQGSPFGTSGEIYNTSGLIVAGPPASGSLGAVGASHAGLGGAPPSLTPSAPYGRVEDAQFVGSGGGGLTAGGNGGGLVTISAGTLLVGGTIRADGGTAPSFGAGGSGGSIRLVVGTLSGAGIVQARGGTATGFSTWGGGSGGRVAVYFTTRTFPDSGFHVRGGGDPPSASGAAGTVYLKDAALAAGNLIVDNEGLSTVAATPILTGLTSFHSTKSSGAARLAVQSGPALGLIAVSGGTMATSGDFSIPVGSDLTVSASGQVIVTSGTRLTLGSFDATNVVSGQVQVAAGGRLDVSSGSVTVGSGVTLLKDGSFGAADSIGSMTILAGGVVSHSARLEEGLVLGVTGTLNLQASGLIDVNSKGLRGGGANGSSFGNSGEIYNTSGVIVSGPAASGSLGAVGASHGGQGGEPPSLAASAPYGRAEDAQFLGSGASCLNGGGGGSGGGRVTINAGTLVVDGTIRADGGAATTSAGGGSGGSIRLVVGALSGAGVVQARGGTAFGFSTWGGGGGGRVAVYFTTNTFPDSGFQARGGGNPPSAIGASGTIYLKDNAQVNGDLIIDNGAQSSTVQTQLRTSLVAFRHLTVRAGGRLEIASSVEPHLNVADLLVDGAGSLLTTAPRDLSGLRVSVATALTLSNGGRIDAVGDGLLGGRASGNAFGNSGETFASDGVTAATGSSGGSAGSYGGLGGGGTPNATYGINVNPKQAGSGGSVSTAAGTGGPGGGRLWIDAATCSIPTGTAIVSDGGAAVSGSGAQGGGSGGAIKLDCPTISGGGSITAKGGTGSGTNGHGGGGGRVALRTNINNFTGSTSATVAAAGGAATGSGQAGQLGTFFVGDLVAPRVTAMSPAPGATIIGDLSQVQVTFTENLYAPGLTNNHVVLTGAASGAHVPMSLSFNTGNQTLTITYAAPLPQDTYTLTLISGEELDGLSDSSINALDGEYAGAFPSGNGASGGSFVAAFGVNTAPRVVEVVPAANALSVPEASNVTVRFSEPINPATVTTASFRLLANGTPVPATVTVSTSGTRATLDPTPVLSLDTLYTVDVSSSVTDLTGVPAVPFTSLFRTSTTPTGSRTLPSVSDQATGLAAQSRTGAAVAGAGDLNGDQVNDWIAGAPSYQSPTGFSAGPVEAGAALVYLGSTSATERTAPDIVFTGVSAHDRAGVSVASNFDFNGDGINDIVIGAEQVNRTPDDDPVAGCNAGAPCGPGKVYLIYFDPSDSVHYPNLGNPSVSDVVSLSLVGQPGGIPGVVFTGVALGDQAGFSVAGGGTSTPGGGQDIVIGAPGADPGARTDAGAAYVVFDNNALSGNISLTRISDGLPDQVPGTAYLGAAAGDNLGYSTAFGGDVVQGQTVGTGSVLMGAPSASSHRGVSFCPPGDPDTTPIIVDAVGTTHSGFQIRGTQDGEQVGYSIASGGDAFADGAPDLLIGAPTYDADIRTDAGRALETTQIIASGVYDADAVGTTLNGAIWTGASSGDELGHAVAGVHDVTGDGYDDVVLGAPFVDPIIGGVPQADAGAVYLIDGAPATGHLGTLSVSNVGTTIAGESLTGTQPGEHAGSSIAGTGDIDGNGDGDFIVGAPDKDVVADPDAGTVYLVTKTELPPAGSCGPGGCAVSDLLTGAQVTVGTGALATTVNLAAAGILGSGSLPGPVPAGKLLLGAAEFDPEGQSFSSPFATIYVPTIAALEAQLTNLESLSVSYWTGASWAPAGFNGTVVTNPQYPSRKAITASVSVFHVYAVFLNDADGDGIRDERDNCPAVANSGQQNADGDAFGDACDLCTDTDGDGFGDPGFPANTCALDNCPTIANPSQTDTDHDGIGDACECVSVNCDDANVCTDDSCNPASGCVHTNNAVSCDDGNPCTAGDLCGGGVCSGSPVPPPPEAGTVTASADKATFSWPSTPSATRYDVVRGNVSALPVGPGGADEVCFDNLAGPSIIDPAAPAAGTGFWYLSRGESACGNGTFGYRSNGSERLTTTCP